MRANWLAALAALLLSTGVAFADSKESALSTVTPGGNDTVTGLQAGANVNFTTLAISNIMSNATNLGTGTLSSGRLPAFTGDCTTSAGSSATTCLKTNGVAFGTSATVNTGTSGATVPLNNGNNTLSGTTTLNGTVSGTGVTNLFASPPAIGGSAPAAGAFTTLSATGNLTTNITGSTECVQANSSGVLSGTGVACGSGGGASVSLTSSSANLIITPSPLTSTGTISSTQPINAQTGAGYVVLAADATKLITLANVGAQTLTLPQAGSAGFASGFSFCASNVGAGTWTISTTISTINGAGSTLSLPPGMGTCLASDGANWGGVNGSPTVLTVASGGTGQSSGISGGVPYFSSSSVMTSSTVLGAGLPVIGGGAGSQPQTGTKSGNTNKFGTVTGSPVSGNCASFDASGNISDAGAPCGSGSGSGGAGTYTYSDNGLTLTANTYFAPIGGGGIPQTTEASVQVKSPSATTVSNLNVSISTDPGAGQNTTITLRKGGVDTALTCTITGGSGVVCQDVTHSVSVAANDLLDWKIVTSGTYVATPTVTIAANNGISAGGGTVSSGTALQLAYYSSTGTIVLGNANLSMSQGNLTIGQAASPGTISLAGNTSGSTKLQSLATASGTLTFQSVIDTVGVLATTQTFSAAQRGAPVTLNPASNTYTPNFDASNNMSMALIHASCPCVLANPSTTLVAGQSGMFAIAQSATGSDTIQTYGSQYLAVGGTSTITLSTAGSTIDYLPYYTPDGTHVVLGGIVKGPVH